MYHTRAGPLVDRTAGVGTLDGLERFDRGRLRASCLNRRIRMAVLGRPDQVHATRFGELVVRNRGDRFRVFTDRPQAERWLESTLSNGVGGLTDMEWMLRLYGLTHCCCSERSDATMPCAATSRSVSERHRPSQPGLRAS